MANNQSATNNAINTKCSYCGDKFDSIQQCLKHELINHSLQKKKNPQNRVQKRLYITAKSLNTDEKQKERLKLKEQLKKCKSGEELLTIFELFCMKKDSLGLIVSRVLTCLERELRPAGIVRIFPFGSIANGLALRDCDIDIFVDASDIHISPRHKHYIQNEDNDYRQRLLFNHINNLLHRSSCFTEVFAIRRARVPIIKCKHKITGFSIDINVSCPSSRENTQFIYDLVKSDERIHELMLFLKLWAKNAQIIGKGNMTSYCFITMVIFFLQQPWNSLENNSPTDQATCILKSIKELQKNCSFHMVQGINYAYDLRSEENKPKISTNVTTWNLIKSFFNFYKDFNFEDLIISTYYGKAIEKSKFSPDTCDEYYKQLRTITQHLQGEQTNNLQIDRCMCVQDAFCLNKNTAKNIFPLSMEYITLCLRNAHQICENVDNLELRDLYEKLLFESIKINPKINETNNMNKTEVRTDLKNLKIHSNDTKSVCNSNNEGKLNYTIIPAKGDLRTLSNHYPELKDSEVILRRWCHEYMKAIEVIITKLYHMEMQKQVPSQQKQQKLDPDNKNQDLNQTWHISCSIDLWSNRYFQKIQQISFLNFQLQQTERLHNLRRQDPKFSVNLNGVLKFNTLANYMGINIQLELPDSSSTSILSLTKKSPLRKFFNVFKNTLQICNFKETLNINESFNEQICNKKVTAQTEDINQKSNVNDSTMGKNIGQENIE
ncbi:monkey king protein isoform 1-T2 [Cochliomyia hominivorax]